MLDIGKQLEIERAVRLAEQELADRLLRFDKDMRLRILAGLMIRVESMPDSAQPPPWPPHHPLNGRDPEPAQRQGLLTPIEEQKYRSMRRGLEGIDAEADPGPTERIIRVLRLAPSRELTAHQIIAELKRHYPAVEHDYVQQVLSRSAKRGGPFGRARKDPNNGLWLYFLRAAPPDGVSASEADGSSDQEDDV